MKGWEFDVARPLLGKSIDPSRCCRHKNLKLLNKPVPLILRYIERLVLDVVIVHNAYL